MIIKTIEIRDRATFISVIAIKPSGANEIEVYHLMRNGFSDGYGSGEIILLRLNDFRAHYDPYHWGSDARTMPEAHKWIRAHFDSLADGDVVDVQFILGETPYPKISERLEGV